MRIIFMGTPPFAVPTLDALVAAGHAIAAVYTRAPQPAGRGKALMKSAVHLRAEALGLPVLTPRTLKTLDAQAEFAALGADVAVVAAYGLLLPQPVLDAPVRGCLNVHGSLLPRWRGAAPIQRAILAGDAETGITIMQMEAGLDTGPMLLKDATPTAGKTAGELTVELAAMGARLMVETLTTPPAPVPQPEAGVTLAPKISKAEARLDFTASAVALERAVRAYNPAPGAWCEILGERLKILAADVIPGDLAPGVIGAELAIGTADGVLQPRLVQRPGKPAMPVRALLNGWTVPPGSRILA
ncbi:MAG: methionyl-tRNA formyltransferase [Alphaproteobacteria bacterium PA4]|nr:MAG: methionyl-tRNA formyltransferase [Alphaproteobacteria bacterium PA4]